MQKGTESVKRVMECKPIYHQLTGKQTQAHRQRFGSPCLARAPGKQYLHGPRQRVSHLRRSSSRETRAQCDGGVRPEVGAEAQITTDRLKPHWHMGADIEERNRHSQGWRSRLSQRARPKLSRRRSVLLVLKAINHGRTHGLVRQPDYGRDPGRFEYGVLGRNRRIFSLAFNGDDGRLFADAIRESL